MRLKYFLLLLICLSFISVLEAQPQAQPLEIPEGKNFKYYFSRIKKQTKKNNKVHALIYGIKAAEAKKNKKQAKKIMPLLSERINELDQVITTEVLTTKNQLTSANTPDQKVTLQVQLLSQLMNLEKVNQSFNALPSETRNGLPTLANSALLSELINSIPTETETLKNLNSEAANFYFSKAMENKTTEKWIEQYQRIKTLEKVKFYNPEFQSLQEEIDYAIDKGMCILEIDDYKNTSGTVLKTPEFGLLTTEILKNGIYLTLSQEKVKKQYPYFKLKERAGQEKANVKFVLTIQEVIYDKRGVSSNSKTHTKKKEEKEIKAEAEVFTKTAYISFKGQYSIVDLQSGATLESEAFSASGSWSRKWATFKGDKDALPKQKKYLSTLSEEPYPSLDEMIGSTGGGGLGLSQSVEGAILNFAAKYK